MLNKQPVPINFAKGIDTKTDPFQVSPGNFLSLQNSIFTKGGLLQKRNGFAKLAELQDTSSTYLTTFNQNLTAIGQNLQAYSTSSNMWVNKGPLHPIQLNVLPLIRSGTTQTQSDTAIAANGLVCTVYTDQVPNPSGSNVPQYKFVVADSVTGQNVTAPTQIPANAGGTIVGSPRVFLLGNYFIIVFNNVISATNHLQFISVNTGDPTQVTPNVDISTLYLPRTPNLAFDGAVINNNLYLAFNCSDGGGAVRVTYIDSTLLQHVPVVLSGKTANMFSVATDSTTTTPTIYVSFYDDAITTGYIAGFNARLLPLFAPEIYTSTLAIDNITSVAQNGSLTLFSELVAAYPYAPLQPTDAIMRTVCTQAGTITEVGTIIVRSLGIASKAFIVNQDIYLLGTYNSIYQPTYFLVDLTGNVIAKLAAGNGANYLQDGLPSVSVSGSTARFSYLIKDRIQAINKSQTASNATGVYASTGINLVNFNIGLVENVSAEIGNNLHLTGGFLWSYDGYQPVEHGFHLWPQDIVATTLSTGGHLAAQKYFYQVTYEWTDNQGNIFRSAPSIPVEVDLSASMTATNEVTLNIPTLRVTYKTRNPVNIVIYRWSTANQIYYQVTSILAPIMNDLSVDFIQYTDTQSDASIIGNNIIYTTGGVVENIEPPSTSILSLFQSRLFTVSSEDRNTLFFSKQVIPATPAEMSDLFSIYVAPTAGAQGNTGPITALAPMDDKLIVFKENAMYYINGVGPDNTGANNQFSEPIFIAATVGCTNQQSIVFMPNGLMFQSDKGIWLLGRDLSTSYIGAPVEQFNTALIRSALNIPSTNQVRFTLDNGVTLMYDYYYNQWGTFTNIPALSSTLYNELHTYINSLGQVLQESPGLYLDNSSPVIMSFTTGWMNLAGLQGFERFYFMFLLGNYITPFKLNVQFAYDYNPSFSQAVSVTPDNFSAPWGGEQLWGSGSVWGGPPSAFKARVFPSIQKCEAFQLNVVEAYDPSFGVAAGAGLTLSGFNLVVGMKKGYRTSSSARSFG